MAQHAAGVPGLTGEERRYKESFPSVFVFATVKRKSPAAFKKKIRWKSMKEGEVIRGDRWKPFSGELLKSMEGRMTVISLLLFLLLGPPFSMALLTSKCQITEGWLQPHTSEPLSLCSSESHNGLVASCSNVTSLPNDLITVPKQVSALCLSGNVVVHQQAFSSFPELRYLSITLKTLAILPEAFLGLNKLHYLSVQCLDTVCAGSSISTQAFNQLYELQTLEMKSIRLTGHRGIMFQSRLRSLSVTRCCLENFSELFMVFPLLRSVPEVSVKNCVIERGPYFLSVKQHPNFSAVAIPASPSQEGKMNFEAQSFMLSNFPLALSELLALEIDKLDSLSLEKIDDTPKKNQSSYICALVSRFSLRSLMFSQNYYKTFNSQELPGCYSVEKLILQKNKMEQVDSSFLYYLPHLQVLDLSGNYLFWNLCSLMPDRTNFISKLRILDFSGNRLNSLQSDAFICLPYLEELSLNDCGFKKIPISALYNLQQLKVLNLRNNQLHSLANTTFYYLSSLISLDLRGNPIECFPRNSFHGLDLLRELYIGSYYIMPDIYFSVPNVTILVLESANAIDFKRPTAAAFASVQNLSLSGYYVLEKDQNHPLFPSVQLLRWEQAFYTSTFLQPLQYHFPQLEQLIYKYDFSYYLPKEFNLSHLSKLRVLEVHNLPEQSIGSSPMEVQYSFMDLPHLEALKLVNSNIRYISAEFFRRKSKLKLLVLENEEFLALDSDIQDQSADQMPLQYLHFSNTTFRCDCTSAWLISWAARKKRVFVSGLEQAECLDVQLRAKRFRFVSFIEQNCIQDIGLILFTTTCLFLFLCIALPILNATCGLEFLFLCYMLRACCHGWWKGKRERKFEYDAFVSYSSLDQEWVLQELVPNLEQTDPPFLKLCLHNRDFMVGKAIVDNITESLYNSHKAIFVVSCHSLASYWCSLEMSLATYRLLAEQEDTMILLFMEHVPRYQLSAYHRLARLVKKKAYLDWPKDPEAQIIFWKRLRDRLRQHGDMDQQI